MLICQADEKDQFRFHNLVRGRTPSDEWFRLRGVQIIRGEVERGQLPPVGAYIEAAQARVNQIKIITQRKSFDVLSTL